MRQWFQLTGVYRQHRVELPGHPDTQCLSDEPEGHAIGIEQPALLGECVNLESRQLTGVDQTLAGSSVSNS